MKVLQLAPAQGAAAQGLTKFEAAGEGMFTLLFGPQQGVCLFGRKPHLSQPLSQFLDSFSLYLQLTEVSSDYDFELGQFQLLVPNVVLILIRSFLFAERGSHPKLIVIQHTNYSRWPLT